MKKQKHVKLKYVIKINSIIKVNPATLVDKETQNFFYNAIDSLYILRLVGIVYNYKNIKIFEKDQLARSITKVISKISAIAGYILMGPA